MFCDDDLNIEECHFDAGDCCGNDVITIFCETCECKGFGYREYSGESYLQLIR